MLTDIYSYDNQFSQITVPTFDLYIIVEFDTFYELSRHTFMLLASKSSLDYIRIHIFFFSY